MRHFSTMNMNNVLYSQHVSNDNRTPHPPNPLFVSDHNTAQTNCNLPSVVVVYLVLQLTQKENQRPTAPVSDSQ